MRWPLNCCVAAGFTRPSGEEARMTDFRLLRHGGFYHAVARYGPDLWTPFTYAGLHATETVLHRKERHRFWGLDSYSHEEGRHLRIGNGLFQEDPDERVEPSAQVVVASDAWARELARRMLSRSAPTLFCDTDGRYSPAVELRPSRDLVSDPAGHPSVGRPGSGEPVAEGQPGRGCHQRQDRAQVVHGSVPVPGYARLLAGGCGLRFRMNALTRSILLGRELASGLWEALPPHYRLG